MTAHQPENISLPLADSPCFIEHQFPVAKVSMESYKERKAGASQTLVGLGNWKGRKPLVLVRAALLGLLLPATNNPEKDQMIFLKLMTMDQEGLWQRKSKPISSPRLVQELAHMAPSLQKRFLADKQLLNPLDRSEKNLLQQIVFERMPYSEKLEYCDRPEQIEGPSSETWQVINEHLATHAHSLPELVQQLGEMRFGHPPRVGDAFCGGGSIPFEAARLGCDTFGSDLNPMAALLTWTAIHVLGGGEKAVQKAKQAQEAVFRSVDDQIVQLGVEHNSLGWRADAYLYCVEVKDPVNGWMIPLLPSFIISEQRKIIVRLLKNESQKRYEIEVIENVSEEEFSIAQKNATIRDSRLIPPDGSTSTPIEMVRRNQRLWENEDIIPRPDDIFQERLYCVRWEEKVQDSENKIHTVRHYRAPNAEDFLRESKVIEMVQSKFSDWQSKGFLPNHKIEPGQETTRLQRERGWTYWHHLFTPRQLLYLSMLSEKIGEYIKNNQADQMVGAGLLSSLGKCCDLSSRLCRWSNSRETIEQTFYNQALNTLNNYATRGLMLLKKHFIQDQIEQDCIQGNVHPCDCRSVSEYSDIWITDPPYADAVNYDEISEFFLAWQEKHILNLFPGWYSDSKRSLAVKGNGLSFRQSMVDCYKTLSSNMPTNGLQIVMFTHQDAGIWADLSMILWAAGLRVTAAWTISTETSAAFKQGNFVQGTVLMVLRKRVQSEPVFLDEISHQIDGEVRRQLDEMTKLEDNSDPNFGDADYQLAAYAAALRVLTERPIVEINPEKEILREHKPGEESEIEKLIRRAVKIACDHLVPRGLSADLWKQLSAMERFYIKGLEIESHAEYRSGVYQELARGFGAQAYTDVLESTKANETRLKSASEFGKKMLSGEGFASSLLRQCLFAISLTVKSEDTREGLNYLHTELRDYWQRREKILGLLDYLAALRHTSSMTAWQKDSQAAQLLSGAVRNDHV